MKLIGFSWFSYRNVSVKSNCARYAGLTPLGISLLFCLGWQITRGWETLAAKRPAVGTKKEGKQAPSSIHVAVFDSLIAQSNSATLSIFDVKVFVSVNLCHCNSAILIKPRQNHS